MAAQMNRNDGEPRKYKRKQKENEKTKQWKEKKLKKLCIEYETTYVKFRSNRLHAKNNGFQL